MAYSDFTLAKAKATFGLTLEEGRNLFAEISPISPSDRLEAILADYIPLATAIDSHRYFRFVSV